MSELLSIIEKFILNNPALVTWGVVVLLVLIGIALQSTLLKEYMYEWKLNFLLKKLGRESLHNVVIPDGMDGKIYIEHLILTPHEILLLAVKRYRGLIFAAETIDLWTQVIGKKSYKFENPLHQLESDALALNSHMEKSKITSKVLFLNDSVFPKGKPDNIISIRDIKKWRRDYAVDEISDVLRTDWKRLLDLASKDAFALDKGVSINNKNTAGLNMFALISISGVITLWLVWRLMY